MGKLGGCASLVLADDLTPSLVIEKADGTTLSVCPEEDGTETYALIQCGERWLVLGKSLTITQVQSRLKPLQP